MGAVAKMHCEVGKHRLPCLAHMASASYCCGMEFVDVAASDDDSELCFHIGKDGVN